MSRSDDSLASVRTAHLEHAPFHMLVHDARPLDVAAARLRPR